MKIVKRCNVWKMKEGEQCLLNGDVWIRYPDIKKRMIGLGLVRNAVLKQKGNLKNRQLFLRGIDVDVIEGSDAEKETSP